jgi:signal transduction histidine kinase
MSTNGSTPSDLYQANILAVDDHPENLEALIEVLAPLGHNIITARSGEEALKCLLRNECAVILLDVRMPGMDGFETAAEIKGRPRTRHIPIIFLTALETDPYHALRGYSEGGVDYISKPYDPWMLRSKVAVFVELDIKNHQLREQAQALAGSNRRLVALAAAAEAANRTKSAFLNMAGHELRTPLAVIMGYGSLLRDGAYGIPPTAFDEPLTFIDEKATELGALVEGILEAAKIEADVLPTETQEVDLNDMASAAVRRALPRASILGGAIVLRRCSEPLPVTVDPQQIGRVLDNLINNSLTYGGGSPEVRVAVAAPDASPRVTVEDDGQGIAPDLEDKIFERFVRGQEAGSGPTGTGLGLYISRELARRNGGDVTLEYSRPGEGSRFALTIGRLQTSAPDRDDQPSSVSEADPSGTPSRAPVAPDGHR